MSGESAAPIIRERIAKVNSAQYKSTTSSEYKKQVQRDKLERSDIVLWKAPVVTFVNFVAELISIFVSCVKRLYNARVRCLFAAAIIALLYFLCKTEGAHSKFLHDSKGQFLWGLYWIWLGILSSVGLGTGLHTFLLFLGPFIAKVTLAAYECGSTDFPSPPYPDEIVCPENSSGGELGTQVSLWTIMAKVRFPAFCWGAGTALGELPPYFMARAAAVTGSHDEDDDDLVEFEQLLAAAKNPDGSNLTPDLLTRGKLFMHNLVQRVGFFGILAAASIPNPLFDLAGITCGHFLVPFWTFFGATLIGKAVVKMHIQKLFIIFVFTKQYVDVLLSTLQAIPYIGAKMHDPIASFFEKQRAKLHSGSESSGGNFIGQIFEIFIFVMVAYFIVTIINSLAQSRMARIQKEARDKKFNTKSE